MHSLPVWRRAIVVRLLFVATTLILSCPVPAQDTNLAADVWWDSAFSVQGFNSTVSDLVTRSNAVFATGRFTRIGTNKVRRVAKWNGRKWTDVGGGIGMTGEFGSALALSGSNVYVGGYFSTARQTNGTSIPVRNIARWNGIRWSDMAGGVNGPVYALAAIGSNVYAGGQFTYASGEAAGFIARWDGRNWWPLGSGLGATVWSIMANGSDLYVGGDFSNAGSTPAYGVARWDGTNWFALGAGLYGYVASLVFDGVNLYAGGSLDIRGRVSVGLDIAKWDGVNWFPVATNLFADYGVSTLHYSAGSLYAAGQYERPGVAAFGVAMLSSCGWVTLGSGVGGTVGAIAEQGGRLYVCGTFSTAGGKPAFNIARWNAANRPALSATDSSIMEGNFGTNYARFAVSVCPAPAESITVRYFTENNTAEAGEDYVPTSGTLVFPPGTISTQYITVSILGDIIYEDELFVRTNERFYLNLRSTDAIVQNGQLIGTIIEDDAQPTLSVADVAQAEGDSGTNTLRFDLQLSGPHSKALEISCFFYSGTAGWGEDFLGHYFLVTIPPGHTNATVPLAIVGDTALEADETFSIEFSSPHLNSVRAEATILNDDLVPTLSVIGSANGAEGFSQASVYLMLSGPSSNSVTVSFSSAERTALAGLDYVPRTGRVEFPPGITLTQLWVAVIDDDVADPDEEFIVNFGTPSNVTLIHTQAVVHIYDNDRVGVPSGFEFSILTTNLALATRMEFAPDGRLFVCEQEGAVRIIKDGVLLPTPFLTVDATIGDYGEPGLLGIAVDPGFASNQFVYVYYTVPNSNNVSVHNRVSRFTADGDTTVPGSEMVILELGPLRSAQIHNAGAIAFGPDGKLYVAVGENGYGPNSQTLTNRLGKILRINSDGSIPQSNPFYNSASGVNRAIWALGLRNPFAFTFQPGTGRMFINDVGWNTWEEINQGVAGANYGWPNAEGPSNNQAYRNPFHAYHHGSNNVNGCSITGGAFYNPVTDHFPAEFVGNYFFADFCGGWIRRLIFTNGIVTTDFVTGLSRAVDIKVGPDGALYCLTHQRWDSAVYKFTFDPTSRLAWLNPTPDNRVLLRSLVVPGWTYTLEASSDLIDWHPIATNMAIQSVLDFYDSPSSGNRFYRLLGRQ